MLERLGIACSFGANVVFAERLRHLCLGHDSGHEVCPERFPPACTHVLLDVALSLTGAKKPARIMPLQESMKAVNDWLGEEVMRFEPYALASSDKAV